MRPKTRFAGVLNNRRTLVGEDRHPSAIVVRAVLGRGALCGLVKCRLLVRRAEERDLFWGGLELAAAWKLTYPVIAALIASVSPIERDERRRPFPCPIPL